MGRPRRSATLVIGLALLFVTGPGASPAVAASCSGARENWFDGRFTFTTNTFGSSARVTNRPFVVCTGASTFTTVWTMLATTATSGWAQSGIVRDTAFSSSKYSFTQYKRNSSTPAVTGYYSQYASDPSNVLKTEYNFSTARIDMWINSTKFATTNFDPNSYWGAQPWSSQYSAETGHCQSDVPGTSTAKSEYRSVLKKTGAGTWIAPAVFESVSPDCSPRYRIEWAGSPSFNVWTQ